jgi:hypothetical protein
MALFRGQNDPIKPVLNTSEMSTFQFTLQDQPITEKEAAIIVAVTSTAEVPSIKIELTKLIKLQKLNTKRLFDLAIDRKDESLAQLAWKLSILPQSKTRVASTKSPSLPRQIADSDLTASNVIATICGAKSNWAAGVAIILSAVYQMDKAEGELTIRSISEMFVNQMWFEYSFPPESSIFKGFKYVNETRDSDAEIIAVVSKEDADSTGTYNEGPVYSSVRAGLLWAKAHQLVEVKEAISHGSSKKDSSGIGEYTQRKYYQIFPTRFGRDVIELWGDCIAKAVNYFDVTKG